MVGKGKGASLQEQRGTGDDRECGLAVVKYSGGLGIHDFASRDKVTVTKEMSSSAHKSQKPDAEEKSRISEDKRLDCAGVSEITKAKCFNMMIPPRVALCLGPQLVLPDGRSARLATCSHEPVGSSKRDNVGVVPRPMVVLAMKAKDSSVPCIKRQRKKKVTLSNPELEAVEPCKAGKRKRKRKKGACPSASPPPEDDCLAAPEETPQEIASKEKEKRKKGASPFDSLPSKSDGSTLPEEAEREFVGNTAFGDLPLAEVPPSTCQEKAAMDTWVQAILRDVLGNDDDTEILLHSPLAPGYVMGYGSENEEEGVVDQREKNDHAAALPSPLPFSGSDTGNTSEWLDSLDGMDEAESGAARVVQKVQNLVRVAGYAPRLKTKVQTLKKRGASDRKALLAVRGKLRESDAALRDKTVQLEKEKDKFSLMESKLKEAQRRLEEAECNLKKEQDRAQAAEKEVTSQRVIASSVHDELVDTGKQVKQLQDALEKENVRAKSLEEDLRALRIREPGISCGALSKDDAPSSLSVSEDVISAKIHSCSQEVRSVLLGLKAKGLSPLPSKPGTALEACECLSRDTKLLGGATHMYGRTMATHTLAMGVSAVHVRGEGVESLRGKLTLATRAFYEKNKDELTKLSLGFVVARDPNKRGF